jgi:hypothetical protein
MFDELYARQLMSFLKLNCPVDTGTLKNYGIQIKQVGAGKWEILVGIDATFPSGRNPSEYVYATQFLNTSKGWIERSIKQWINWIKNNGGN